MSSILRGSLALIALAAAPFVAFADAAGTAESVSGAVGSVTVVRGADTYSLSASNELFAGDKVIVNKGGASTLKVYGCTISLSAMESFVVKSGSCDELIASVAKTSAGTVLGAVGAGSDGVILVGAVGAGAIAVAVSGAEDDKASSP